MRPPFRFRSPQRDAETTADRTSAVLAVIAKKKSEATSEMEGLAARLEAGLQALSFAFNDAAEFEVRDSADERHISQLEQDTSTARRRVQTLAEEIAAYESLAAQAKEMFRDHGSRSR